MYLYPLNNYDQVDIVDPLFPKFTCCIAIELSVWKAQQLLLCDGTLRYFPPSSNPGESVCDVDLLGDFSGAMKVICEISKVLAT
jgi:hypothetical protein